MTAAASGLAAETTSASIRTAVVTQAANLGPRTSTRSGSTTVLLLDTVLLLEILLRGKRGHAAVGGPKLLRVRAGALLLSSYSNNNNPRCGTDRLRDAW